MTKAKTEPKPTPLEELQQEEEVDFWEQWGALGPGKQVAVCREPGRVWLAMIPLNEDFGPELVKDRWGGGKYSFRARENGKFMTGMAIQHIEIEGAPRLQLPAVVEDTPEIMELRKKLDELTGNGSQPETVGNNVMVAVVGMMAPLLTAIVTQAMDRPPQAGPVEMMELYRKLAKDARRDAPNGDGPIMDPVKDLGIPLLHELREMRQLDAGKKNGAVVATPPASADGATTEPTEAANPTARVPSTMQELAEFVAHWCAPHVARGASPSLRAEVLLEDLAIQNPPLLIQVVNLSRLDDVLEHWAAMVPTVGASKEWHGEFISEVGRLSDESTEGVDATDDPEGGSGHPSDSAANGTPLETGVEV